MDACARRLQSIDARFSGVFFFAILVEISLKQLYISTRSFSKSESLVQRVGFDFFASRLRSQNGFSIRLRVRRRTG
jgi:hypothetical protein